MAAGFEADDSGMLNSIGPWSEVKLEIIREYAKAYSTILSARTRPTFRHKYIDAFAGAGRFVSRQTGMLVPGSPLNALSIEPPFLEYYFIDIDDLKVSQLEQIAEDRSDVVVYTGDANAVLRTHVLPKVRWDRYERALCLLDPYGMDYEWSVVEEIGRSRAIDLFLNFPVMDINRNALRRNPDTIDPAQAHRMSRFWGDESWRTAFYEQSKQLSLFAEVEETKSVTNQAVVDAYQRRLREVAGFGYVPTSMPMRNSIGAEVYHLLFASHQPVAVTIVEHIFEKYRARGLANG